jgi:molecular chaperone IbpA
MKKIHSTDLVNRMFTPTPNLQRLLDEWSIGFDRTFRELENFNQTFLKDMSKVTYPPFNIVKVDENKYVLELALAGFSEGDVEVELNNDQLVIKGKQSSDERDEGVYLYKGLASRAFTRQWKLSDNITVKNATMLNGVLRVWLEAVSNMNTKRIPINKEEAEDEKTLLTE